MDERRLFSWLFYSAALRSLILMKKRRQRREGRMERGGGPASAWINEGRPLTDGVTPADGCFNYSPSRSTSCQRKNGNELLLGALFSVFFAL